MQLIRALPSFDDPLELLGACHDNVRRFTGLLEHLAALAPQEHAHERSRAAAAQILNYFDRAAPHHHADEEEDLFPRLRRLGDAELDRAIDRLEAEHRSLGAVWQELRLQLIALSESRPARLEGARAFAEAYREHAAFEDRCVYPAASRLEATELREIGNTMAARRGAPHPGGDAS